MDLKNIIETLTFLYDSYGKDDIKISSINVLNDCIKVFYYRKNEMCGTTYEFTYDLNKSVVVK